MDAVNAFFPKTILFGDRFRDNLQHSISREGEAALSKNFGNRTYVRKYDVKIDIKTSQTSAALDSDAQNCIDMIQNPNQILTYEILETLIAPLMERHNRSSINTVRGTKYVRHLMDLRIELTRCIEEPSIAFYNANPSDYCIECQDQRPRICTNCTALLSFPDKLTAKSSEIGV